MKKGISKAVSKRAAPKAGSKSVQASRQAAAKPVLDLAAVMAELGAIKALLTASPQQPAAALEEGVAALRRVLSETIEQHNEAIIKDVAAVVGLLLDGGVKSAVQRLESLLEKLGAVRFEAERLDFFDPLIHTAAREDCLPDVPDGVVTATLRPGYKTGRGVIAAKACVAVNRRR